MLHFSLKFNSSKQKYRNTFGNWRIKNVTISYIIKRDIFTNLFSLTFLVQSKAVVLDFFWCNAPSS